MSLLKKKYQLETLDNLTEKDIIYFCRDSLNTFYKKEKNKEITKSKYEKEILNILKSKDWDFKYKDIDGNNLLTYPVYTNSFLIVEYFLNNKIYEINQYDEDLSNSLCSSIKLSGEKMIDFILSYNPHPDYLNDMAYAAYTLSPYMSSKENADFYLDLGNKLSLLDVDFTKLITKFLTNNRDYDKQINNVVEVLQNHPLELNDKVNITNNLIKELEQKPHLPNKYKAIKNWLIYHDLQSKTPVNEKTGSKIKI